MTARTCNSRPPCPVPAAVEPLEARLLLSAPPGGAARPGDAGPAAVAEVVSAVPVGIDLTGRPNRPMGSISIRFDGDVPDALSAGALTIRDDITGGPFAPGASEVACDPATNTATWVLDLVPGGALAGGRFTVRLAAEGIVDGLGRALDGDGDGNPGGDMLLSFLVAAAGDCNLDGWVDGADRAALVEGFGREPGTGPTRGDADGDGDTDAMDYLAWKANVGARVVPSRVPRFRTPLAERYVIVPGGGGLTLGVDGYDADGDALAISARSDSPELSAAVSTGNRSARLRFVEADGVTPIGNIVVELFERRSPAATERFITLATRHVNGDGTLAPDGPPFYTNVPVHRVIDGFMIQTGDAVNGDGTGGSGLGAFDDAFDPTLSFTGRGVLACANAGPDTNDSQFFLTEAATTWLDGRHMVFGQVLSGWDVLDAISEVPTDGSDRPVEVPLLASVEIFDNPQGRTVTVSAGAGFAGEAHLTVALDDGAGNVVEQVVTVSAQVALGAPGEVASAPGQQAVFTPTLGPASAGRVALSAWADGWAPAENVRVDGATHEVTVDIPAEIPTAYNTLRLSAEVVGADNAWPVQAAVSIAVAGEPPVIEPVEDIALPAGQSAVVDLAIRDDTPRPVQLAVATAPSALAASIDPQTHRLTLTAPATGSGLAAVTVSAVEGGFVDRTPAERTVYVAYGAAAAPGVLRRLAGSPGGSVEGLAVLDGLMYAAAGSAGLEVYDLADPAGPRLVAAYALAGQAHDVAVVRRETDGRAQTLVFVAALYGGVTVLDATDPAGIATLDTLDVGNAAVAVAVEADVLYVAHWTTGLSTFDVSDPADIRLLDTAWNLPGGFTFGYVVDVVPRGESLYAVDAAGGFVVLDVSDPADIKKITEAGTGASPWGAVVEQERLYVLAEHNGLIVYDISSPQSPVYLGHAPMTLAPWVSFDVAGGLAAVAGPGECTFLDVTDPAGILLLGAFQVPLTPWRPLLLGPQLALPLGEHGLVLVDVPALLAP